MISINSIMYYGRSFDVQYDWWFCLEDERVYSSDEMRLLFGFSNEDQIIESGVFLKLFKTDIPSLKKLFVKNYPYHKLEKMITAICNQEKVDFNVAFNICAETAPFRFDWFSFEKQQLESDAVSWCESNGLPYIN